MKNYEITFSFMTVIHEWVWLVRSESECLQMSVELQERAVPSLCCSMTPQLVSCKSPVDSRHYAGKPVVPAPCVGRSGEVARPTSTWWPLLYCQYPCIYWKQTLQDTKLGSESLAFTGFNATGKEQVNGKVMLGRSSVWIPARVPTSFDLCLTVHLQCRQFNKIETN
jgi:hypothetical protein